MKYTKLKYNGFEDYLFEESYVKKYEKESLHYIFKFKNGYGASVVKNIGSYGNTEDLFELAVIKFSDDYSWELCYDKKITSDVIGWLDNDDVIELLERIKNL